MIREPAVLDRLTGLGALTRANTVEEFTAFREQQIAFFAEMVKMAEYPHRLTLPLPRTRAGPAGARPGRQRRAAEARASAKLAAA